MRMTIVIGFCHKQAKRSTFLSYCPITYTVSLWLNADKRRVDWTEPLDQTSFQGSITLDKNIKDQETVTRGCPIMELRKQENSVSMPALITMRDCDSNARFLCTLDMGKAIRAANVDKRSNLSCLLPANNKEQNNARRKRDTNGKIRELLKEKKGSMYLFISVSNYPYTILS